MSLWKIGADDVSQETQNFKDKLASKGEYHCFISPKYNMG